MKKLLIAFAFVLSAMSSFAQDIFQAARANDVAQLEQLQAQGVDVNQADARGFTPLILAVYNESYEATRWLLQHGAHPNAQDRSGNTALMGAIFKGYPKLAEILIAQHADVNLTNFNQASPLIFAATFGQKQIAALLIEKGADKSLKDNSGKTALDHATLQENSEMIRLLQ